MNIASFVEDECGPCGLEIVGTAGEAWSSIMRSSTRKNCIGKKSRAQSAVHILDCAAGAANRTYLKPEQSNCAAMSIVGTAFRGEDCSGAHSSFFANPARSRCMVFGDCCCASITLLFSVIDLEFCYERTGA